MSARQSHRESHRNFRQASVLAIVVLSLASIALDVSNGTLGWSLACTIGSVVVLVAHSRLSPRHDERPALRLLDGRTRTTSSISDHLANRATG